tara:strand:+ start:2822 stop:3787 length:966 start_codon:yes stop_codon:yes gene_type:complete
MTDFTIKKLDIYDKKDEPRGEVSNRYETSPNAISQPCLMYVSAVRNSGKSYSVSKMVRGLQRERVFDSIKLITPTFNSNKAYFGDLIKDPETDVLEPTRDSIQRVIDMVEADRDEFEKHLEDLKEYNEFTRLLRSGGDMSDEQILKYIDLGFLNERFEKPVFKYEKFAKTLRAPQTLVILDDILSSPAILQSSGLTKLATLNRHVAPLKETFKNRSACGIAVIIISQTYNMPQGISRCLRENVTHLMLFKNRQEKQLAKIREELGSAVDEQKFNKAYEYATSEKYGNLLVTFAPKCPTQTFRKNLNELIIFSDDKQLCKCN